MKIESTKFLKEIMGNYFKTLSSGEKKVAWCTSVGPAELLRSFGFEVYFPENHGALLGTTRTSMDCIPEAVKCGYSGHVCSYTTADIGASIKQQTPLQSHYGIPSPPKPDLIVYNTNQCREVQDWFNFYAKKYDCPIAGVFPPRHLDEVTEYEVSLVAEQFMKLVPFCEEASGVKFDLERFRDVVRMSKDATLLWQRALRTAKAPLPPISFFDSTIHMGPIVVLRGSAVATEYYSRLVDELEDHIAQGRGIVSEPQTRIFWEGMPIWGKLRMLSDLFIQNKSAVVASTYCSSWIFDQFDEDDPWNSTARAYTEIFINRSEKAKMKMLADWFAEYRIDGVIFHDSKTCFNNSNARFGMPQRLKAVTGVPALVIEGDLCDLRFFSEGQSVTRIETFLEQLESLKTQKS
jgi:benzoyl-CoA reductase/2-hydroxyglutaryl-CoA dehydratase subunit BcrC/BadD/HgdB